MAIYNTNKIIQAVRKAARSKCVSDGLMVQAASNGYYYVGTGFWLVCVPPEQFYADFLPALGVKPPEQGSSCRYYKGSIQEDAHDLESLMSEFGRSCSYDAARSGFTKDLIDEGLVVRVYAYKDGTEAVPYIVSTECDAFINFGGGDIESIKLANQKGPLLITDKSDINQRLVIMPIYLSPERDDAALKAIAQCCI